MKRNIGITKRLFFITTLAFALFLIGTFLVQSLFFEEFYIGRKKDDIKSELTKLKAEYVKLANSSSYPNLLNESADKSGIRFILADSQGRIEYTSRSFRGKFDPTNSRGITEYIKIQLNNPERFTQAMAQNRTITSVFRIQGDREKVLLAITPVAQTGELILGVTSLQPVNEAARVIKSLYPYFFADALVFVVILALIYSRLIAKPLVNMNRTAAKMAHLDFSEECIVKRQDEIGNLAASLNFLSENLNHALTSLKTANAKLEADIEKERNLEKMRKGFVASVSHELKTPISLISGYAGGLRDNIFEGEEKDYYLDIIMDEAQKMGRLVSDMLDLSQLESGNFKLSREEFILTELVRFSLKKFETLIEEKQASLSTSLLEDVPVYADWNRLDQVMTNFITNALRHVSPGGSITVRMVEKERHISLEVENTGAPIPEDERAKIWDKFYKVDKSGSRKLGGTGVGLSIVKNILSLHEYPFGVENTASGVMFYFLVPKDAGQPGAACTSG